jgi:deoxyribodipyrimidine photo-lyase
MRSYAIIQSGGIGPTSSAPPASRRIFNPVAQGEKFDPQGLYIRRWVPELQHLPTTWIHKPWQAPAAVLREAGVAIGEAYPRPIVDHARARQRALAALRQMKA